MTVILFEIFFDGWPYVYGLLLLAAVIAILAILQA